MTEEANRICDKLRNYELAVTNGKIWLSDVIVLNQAADLIEQLSAELDAVATGGWISVEDRLPSEGMNVLVFIPYHGCNLHYVSYLENGKWYVPDRFGRFDLDGITHWMPMAEPPKEDAK